ncbi:hypothetical protein FHT71_003583 [Rhizobium sp. BK060]|nr:hypothetical protein [Rhizobium sp. BK060]
MADYIDWPGHQGTYRYWFLDSPAVPSSIKKEGGNYMFAKPTQAGWVPVYIGVADDLSSRVPYHDRWADAVRAGATHVLAHVQPNATHRASEERDLISYWSPPLNTHHRQAPTVPGGLGSVRLK